MKSHNQPNQALRPAGIPGNSCVSDEDLRLKNRADRLWENTDFLKGSASRFRIHSTALSSRSDQRALWMTCIGVTLCELLPERLELARAKAHDWMVSQPSRAPLYKKWLELLQSQTVLETVLEPTPENQQLRSACPLSASIQPKEHRAALACFRWSLTRT